MSQEPFLRIVRGHATADEVAAITAVLLSLKKESPAEAPIQSRWADRARLMRRPMDHRSGSWRNWSA